jgi:Icc-related predicted phosphoesterase
MGFRDRMLSLIDSSAQQAKSLVESINDTFEKIDFDSSMGFLAEKRDALLERGNSLLKDFGELLKQVKDSFNDFSVTVPFDEELGEVLEYKVEGDKLTVEVKFEDETSSRSNKTVVVIPANCDTSKVNKTINKVTKTAVISIPKRVSEGKENEQAAEAAPQRAPRPQRPPRRVTPPKPKAVKVAQPRGKGGRFVKAGE